MLKKEDITVSRNEDKLEVSVKGEVVRTVSPIHMNAYKFTYEKEEYYFVYETMKIRNKKYESIYLFPITDFPDNKIDI